MTVSTIQHAIDHLHKHDPFLGTIIDTTASQPPFVAHTNYYQELVSSIIGQQLSIKAAATIERRFKALFGDAFPTPTQIINKDAEELRAVGLSYRKVSYIKDLAQHVLDGSVQFDTLDQLSNADIIIELTKIKGIGEWTVHMFLMFCMGRLNVLPTGDLGIRTGIMRLYNLEALPKPDDTQLIADTYKWRPYESVASWYIWQSLNNAPKS